MENEFDADRFDELRQRSQQLLLEFLDREIHLGLTFADFAATERELGNMEHFEHAKKDAERAAEAIRRFSRRITNQSDRAATEEASRKLEDAVAELNRIAR